MKTVRKHKSLLRKSLGLAIVYGLVSFSNARADDGGLIYGLHGGLVAGGPAGQIEMWSASGTMQLKDRMIFTATNNLGGAPAGLSLTSDAPYSGTGGSQYFSVAPTGAAIIGNTGVAPGSLLVNGTNAISLNGATGKVSASSLDVTGAGITNSGTIVDNISSNGTLIVNATNAQLTDASGHGLTVVNNGTGVANNYITLSGGTASTTERLNDDGVFFSDTTNGNTLTVSKSGQAVVGNGTLAGKVTVSGGGTTANQIVLDATTGDVSTGTLHTSGLATLNSAQVNGTLGVTGLTTTTGITNNGTLNNTGDATFGGAISDSNTANGTLVVNGTTATLGYNNAGGQLNGLSVSGTASSFGYNNAVGHLNGISSNATTTTLTGGTNTSTLELTDSSAILTVKGTSSVQPGGAGLVLISATTSATTTTPEVRIGATSSGNVTVNDSGVRLSNNGSAARLRGVADGVDPNDAVNVSQLDSRIAGVGEFASEELYKEIYKVTTKAYSGIAQIAAMSAIPAPPPDRCYSLGVGVGTFAGERAIAIGTRATVSDNVMFSASVGKGFSKGSASAAAMGASFSW